MEYLLEMHHVSKSFLGVKVLNDVDFCVRPGSIHALMGENGAGKSTLMKILVGLYSREENAEIIVDGKPLKASTPEETLKSGISMIHQELTPINEMRISENIFLGRESISAGLFVNFKEMEKRTADIFKQLNVDLSPRKFMKELKVADIQLCEIAKAISYDSKIIIMDEPTSSLTTREANNLFSVIRKLKEQGKGIIYISHKMDEVLDLCDEVTVLRDGCMINTWKSSETNMKQLTSAMVGRALDQVFPKRENCTVGDIAFEVKNLTTKNKFYDVSFNVRRGEVLGVVGLMGAGRTEVMEAIFGVAPLEKGMILIDNKEVKIKKPSDAIKHKIAFISEDRKRQGLVLKNTIMFNITLPSQDQFKRAEVFINSKKEKSVTKKYYDDLKIKSNGMNQLTERLSGGNQQKVVIAKWLMREPDILIMDEPTRGIDVGAKYEIYMLINKMCMQGKSVIMVSSELPEVLGMSDRIVIFSNKKLICSMDKSEYDQEKILEYAMSNL